MRSYASNKKQTLAWIEQFKHDARLTGRCVVQWLERGYKIRWNAWLDEYWGGGDVLEVVRIEFEPRVSELDRKQGRRHGYVRITVRTRNGFEFDRDLAAHDSVELLKPSNDATPTQWRNRCR